MRKLLFSLAIVVAGTLAGQAVEALRPQGYPKLTGWALQFAAELAGDAGDHAEAGKWAAEAFALFEPADCRIGRSRAAKLLAKTR